MRKTAYRLALVVLFLASLWCASAFEVKVSSPIPGNVISGLYEINITCDTDFDNISIYLNDSLQEIIPPGCGDNGVVRYGFDSNLVGDGIYFFSVKGFKDGESVSHSIGAVEIRNKDAEGIGKRIIGFFETYVVGENYFFLIVIVVTILYAIVLFSVRAMSSPNYMNGLDKKQIQRHIEDYIDNRGVVSEDEKSSIMQDLGVEILPVRDVVRGAELEEEIGASNSEPVSLSGSVEVKKDYIDFKKEKELEFFVKHCIRQGYARRKIKQILVSQGWDAAFIEEFIRRF